LSATMTATTTSTTTLHRSNWAAHLSWKGVSVYPLP
jgi:hypothetical protein